MDSSTQGHLLSEFIKEWESDNGITAQTSGSTGDPKSIILPISQIKRSARRTNDFFGIKENSRLHSAISFKFIGGKMMAARSLCAGCELTFSEPSLSPEIPAGANSTINLMAVVPAQIPHILHSPEIINSVGNLLIGGSAIDGRLWDKIVSSGINAWESYGMTETASHIALRKVKGPHDSRPLFYPLKGITLCTNSDGCLIISDHDIRVETNDIVKIYPSGGFEILGRKDDMIITGGKKVMPVVIENLLRPYLENIAIDFYVSSVPDETWTSKLVLIAAPSGPSCSRMEKDRIERALDSVPENILPKWSRPKSVVLMKSLPLLESGKLNRKFRIEF